MSHVVGAVTHAVAGTCHQELEQCGFWVLYGTRNKEPWKVEWVSQETFRELYVVSCMLDFRSDL